MNLISLVYPTKYIIYQNLGEIGEMPCPTLFGGYVERLLNTLSVFRCNGQFFPPASLSPGKDQAGPFLPRGKN